MKKMLFIIFLTLFGFNSIGQVWIDSGAVWHYDFWNVGYQGFYKYEYAQDTVIENHNCQMITGERYVFTKNQFGNTVLLWHNVYDNQFTYVSGDTVFYRNNGKFFILYNFGASIGDKWVVSTSNPFGLCDDTSRIEVTDTGKITINSVTYRFITVQPTSNSPFGLKGTYIERIGNIDLIFAPFHHLFPYAYQCDSLTALVEWDHIKFKCFKDTSFTLYNPSGQECEYYLTHLGIPETKKNDFQCYPNPTSGLLNIESSHFGDKSVEIYNYQGILTRSLQVPATTRRIDISDLKSGMYIIKLQSKTEDNSIIKIIKE